MIRRREGGIYGRVRILIAVLASTLAAHVAFAQPPEETTDVDETTTAAEAAPLAPKEGEIAVEAAAEAAESSPDAPAPSAATLPVPAAPAIDVATTGRPSFLTDPSLAIQGAPTASDLSYETRVLGAFRAVQGAQGALDGRWHVVGHDGAVLYALQITDPGAGDWRIEGAWRNPQGKGATASGFIDGIARENDDLVLSFQEAGAEQRTQLRLRPIATGGFVGETVIGAQRTGVTINRAEGVETASLAVPVWTQPAPPRAKAAPTSRAKAKVKSKSKAKARAKSKSKRKRR